MILHQLFYDHLRGKKKQRHTIILINAIHSG